MTRCAPAASSCTRRDGVRIGRGADDEVDVVDELVRIERGAVVRSDLDVDADDPSAAADRAQQARVEDERAAVRDRRSR